MSGAVEKSANEIEGLVLKAARGGGLALGLAEDLCAATAFLDLDALTRCPCDKGDAAGLSAAIDALVAGQGAQPVQGDAALIHAYVAAWAAQTGQHIDVDWTEDGAVLKAVSPTATPPSSLGRRDVPHVLNAHLVDMGAKLLVPETEASRAAGAGAGLTDND